MSARRTGNGKRVLVTGAEHTGSLAAVRALRAAGYDPWVGAITPRAYAARSRAATGVVALPYSGSDQAAFQDVLDAAVKRLGVTVVIPGTEQDLLAIARSPSSTLRRAAGVPELDLVRRITDKTAVYRLAAELGLHVPATRVVDRDELLDVSTAELPVIVKPIRSARANADGSLTRTDALLAVSREQLRSVARDLPAGQWLLQPRVDGQLGAVSGVALRGQVVATVQQLSHRVWPPGAGVSAFAETVAPDPPLAAGVARLIGALSWSGIFQVQFIHDRHGSHLIDVNPRVYGSLALATAAGVNLPAIWAALVTGSRVDPVTYRAGVCYRSDELDPRALLHMALHGRVRAACKGALPRRHTTHSVLTLADPAPGLTSLGKLTRWMRHA
jgi:predicted ATP-grasp superfamily ATP-dependent carboligase